MVWSVKINWLEHQVAVAAHTNRRAAHMILKMGTVWFKLAWDAFTGNWLNCPICSYAWPHLILYSQLRHRESGVFGMANSLVYMAINCNHIGGEYWSECCVVSDWLACNEAPRIASSCGLPETYIPHTWLLVRLFYSNRTNATVNCLIDNSLMEGTLPKFVRALYWFFDCRSIHALMSVGSFWYGDFWCMNSKPV